MHAIVYLGFTPEHSAEVHKGMRVSVGGKKTGLLIVISYIHAMRIEKGKNALAHWTILSRMRVYPLVVLDR